MSEIIKVLMNRDEMSESEAKEVEMESRARIFEGEDPEEVLYDLGLELDYIFDLI